jgi:hypothetical protein
VSSYPPLWTCPRCGRQFANRNQEHSCGAYTVDDFLRGKSAHALALYRRFVELVEACGPVLIAPAKARIGFQVRMIFAAVNKLTDKQLDAHVILTRRIEHPRFRRIETLTPTGHVHHFRVHSPDELGDEVASWLREAYHVGERST